MNFWRGKFGSKATREERPAATDDGGTGENPGADALFARANAFRAQNGLDALTSP